MYSREEILEEIEQFRNDNPDDTEFYSVIADYIEQIQDESGYYRPKKAEKEPVLAMALAIQIYKVITEVDRKWSRLEPAQLAYALTQDLDFHYEFYYKHGKKE